MAGMKNLPVYTATAGNSSRRAVKAAVYPKAGGTPYIGYVIDGRTYKDPNGKVRIDDGSRVELADGRSYIYNRESGGVPNYATAMQIYENSIKSDLDAYRNSRRNADRAIDLSVSQMVEDLRADQKRVNERNKAAKKELARAYRDATNPHGVVAQRLEALGLGDSGYAESTYAKLGGEYQRALGEMDAAELQALSEIDSAITRAYRDGEIEKAKAWQELEKDILKYSSEKNEKLADMRFKAASAAADDERWQQEWQKELEESEYSRRRDELRDSRDAKEDAYDRALSLVKLGISNNEIAAALGISRAQADAIAARAVAKKSSSGTKTSSSSTKVKSVSEQKKTKMTAAERAELDKKQQEKIAKLKAAIAAVIDSENITDAEEIQRLYDQYVIDAVTNGYITREDLEYLY